jgi:stage II sporulation protein AB (anti-sigma F factor)
VRGERVAAWRTALAPEDALLMIDPRLAVAAGERMDEVLADAARALSTGKADPARRVLSMLSEPAVEAPVVVALRIGATVRADKPLQLRIAPSRAALVHAREATEQFLLDSSLDERATHEVVTAVQEALLNCMRWAYPGGEGPVCLTLSKAGGCLRACVRDEGLGFDVAETLGQAADASRDPLRHAGRGLALMRRLVDRVELISAPGEGTSVVLEKRRGAADAETVCMHEAP